jgi:flavin-dependent dehydrogenase
MPLKREVQTSSGKFLQTRYIIGADGANSIFRKSLPEDRVDQNRWRHNTAVACEISLNREDNGATVASPKLNFALINWGYTWVFPKEDRVVEGVLGLIDHNHDLKKSLNKLLSLIGYKRKTQPTLQGHPVPYGHFLTRPVHGPILLTGDAADFVDPLTGEGIYYAFRSAELVSKAIQEVRNDTSTVLKIYRHKYKSTSSPNWPVRKKICWLLFNGSASLNYKPLIPFFRFFGSQAVEVVHGFRSYQWFLKWGGNDKGNILL